MTQDKIKQIHRLYGWFLAAVLAVLGVLLILLCLDIYTSGPRPYSAEAISLRFQRIAIPVYIGIAGIIGAIALDYLLPFERKRAKAVTIPEYSMLRLRQKAAIPPVQKETRLRLILRSATAFLFIALMIYPLIYFMDPGHFSVSNLNPDVIKAVMVALFPAAAGLILCWICRKLVNNSFRREASIYKQSLIAGQHSTVAPIPPQSAGSRCKYLLAIRLFIIGLAFVFIILGVCNGGAEDVLKKAIAICTECIGLG